MTRRERWHRARHGRFFRYRQPRVRVPKIRAVEPNIYERLPRPGIGQRRSPTRFFVKVSDQYFGSFTIDRARQVKAAVLEERNRGGWGRQ